MDNSAIRGMYMFGKKDDGDRLWRLRWNRVLRVFVAGGSELFSCTFSTNLGDLLNIVKLNSRTFSCSKTALFSADESHEREAIVVEDCHVDEALKELVFEGGELTKRLLGASGAF